MSYAPRALQFFFTSFALSVLMIASAVAEDRYALVVGNSKYQRSPPLNNPANDARDVADRLRTLKFVLIGGGPQIDVTRDQLQRLVRDLADSAKHPSDTLLFYFGGHGSAFGGDNWLIPIDDLDIRSQEDVQDYATSTRNIADRLNQRHAGTTILILDACRDNKLPAKTRAATRGLGRIDVPRGTFVLYSASPGQEAIDGNGRNSLFASALLPLMSEPGYTLEQMVYKLVDNVSRQSGGNQEPMAEVKLTAPFVFLPVPEIAEHAVATAPPAQVQAPAPAPAQAPTAARAEQRPAEEGKILCILPDKSPKIVKSREECRNFHGLIYQ